MDCKKVEDKLIFLLDGSLKLSESEEIQRHMDDCSDCRSMYEYIKKNYLYLETVKDAKPKPFLYTRIAARKSKVQVRRLNPVFAPLAIAAVLAVGLFLGTMIGRMSIPEVAGTEYEVAYLFDDSGLEVAESYLID